MTDLSNLTPQQQEHLLEMGPVVIDLFDPNLRLLHPALFRSVRKLSSGRFGIKHPFVNTPMIMVGQANAQLEAKVDILRKMLKDDAWFAIFALGIERPWALDFLVRRARRGRWQGKEYRDLLAFVWMDAEFPAQNFGISTCIEAFKLADGFVIDEDDEDDGSPSADLARWALVPDEIDLYRGVSEGGKARSISWSLSPHKAEWFAKRFGRKPRVYHTRIRKDEALGYFNGRQENEVVIDPTGRKLTRLTRNQLEAAKAAYESSLFADES
jgi:hypothetical protein